MTTSGRLADWPWLLAISAFTLALIELPYLIAFSQAQHGWVFAGMLWSPHDYAQYASAMRQGAESAGWLIYDQLSHEDHAPALIYPFYVALGKLGASLALDIRLTYHLAELVARVVLMVALYAFTRVLFEERAQRRLAYVIVTFGSGLGAWMLVVGVLLGLPPDSPAFVAEDLVRPELNSFLVFFTAPHLMVGLAAILIWVRAYLAMLGRPSVPSGILLSGMALLVGLTNPFSLAMLLAVAGLQTTVRWWTRRSGSKTGLVAMAITAATAGPMVLYNALVFNRDPFWGATYGAQNILLTAPPLSLAVGYGALLLFALLALPASELRRSDGALLALLWIGLSLVMMYAPIPYQRRFGFGLQPMLALLATVGVLRGITSLRRAQALDGSIPLGWRLARSSAALALFGSTATFYVIMLRAASQPTDQVRVAGAFHHAAVHEAALWLREGAQPDDLVLAETQTANYLAGAMPGRVFSGHWVATADFRRKVELTLWFYQSDETTARRELLESQRIRYVVYGPRERALGGPPLDSSELRPVFQTPQITVYEVSTVAALANAARE